MSKLVFHPTTTLAIETLTRDLPQALLLSGQHGVGLFTTASHLAADMLSHVIAPDTSKTTSAISVEAIRDLYHHTRTKLAGKRVIIIDNADTMTLTAQGAFLKLLEEPNESTHFILTAHTPEKLLPTIRSRVQQLVLPPVSSVQSKDFLAHLGVHETAKQTQLLFLASGLPAELSRLATDADYFKTRARFIGDARKFITASPYQKLCMIQAYKSSRDDTLQLIDSSIAILQFTLQSKPQGGLITQLDKLLDARERIAAHQNIALQLGRTVV